MVAQPVVWTASRASHQTDRLHVLDIRSPEDLRAFLRYQPGSPPLVTGHRGGARQGFPENAIETFQNTLRHTWASLEVDPRLTKDGEAVLFHDPTLERTSTGTGRVIDYTYEELKQFKLKDPTGAVTAFSIPTLGDALDWAKGKTVLFLDNKDVDVLARAKAIEEHDARAWAVILAYTFEDARRVHDFDPAIMMQVFLPDSAAIARFDQTGIPWDNIVGFVTHTQPAEPAIFDLIGRRGPIGILGTSRTIDRAYLAGQIDKAELAARYRQAISTGAHAVEADLPIEAGEALEPLRAAATAKQRYYKYAEVSRR
jgi:glycerophosphoryl diester phosphodiesterase